MALHDAISDLVGRDGSTSRGADSLARFSRSFEPLMRLYEKAGQDFGTMSNHVRKAGSEVVFVLARSASGEKTATPLSDEDWLALVDQFRASVKTPITHCVFAINQDLRKTPDEYGANTAMYMRNRTGSYLFMTTAQREKLRKDVEGLAATAQPLASRNRS